MQSKQSVFTPIRSRNPRFSIASLSSIKKTNESGGSYSPYSHYHFSSTPLFSPRTPKNDKANPLTSTQLVHEDFDLLKKTDDQSSKQRISQQITRLLTHKHKEHLYQAAHANVEQNALSTTFDFYWSEVVCRTIENMLSAWKFQIDQVLWQCVIDILHSIRKNDPPGRVQVLVQAGLVHPVHSIPAHIRPYFLEKIGKINFSLFANQTKEKLEEFKLAVTNFQLTLQQRISNIVTHVIAKSTADMTEQAADELVTQEVGQEVKAYYDAIITHQLIPEIDPNRNPAVRSMHSRDPMSKALDEMWRVLTNEILAINLISCIANKTKNDIPSAERILTPYDQSKPSIEQLPIEQCVDEQIQMQCYAYNTSLTREGAKTTPNAEKLTRQLQQYCDTQKALFLKEFKKIENFQDLEDFRDEAEKNNDKKHASWVAVQSNIANLEETIQLAGEAIKKDLRSKNQATKTPVIKATIQQAIDVMHRDEYGNSLLDKAILLKDSQIQMQKIDEIFACASNNGIAQEILLRDTLNNLVETNKQRTLLILAAHGCLFDKKLVAEIRTPQLFASFSTGADSEFKDLFDEQDNLILTPQALESMDEDIFALFAKNAPDIYWPRINTEINRRYLSSSSTEQKIKLPPILWEIIDKKCKKQKNFEKLANFFEEAIVHTVTEYKEAPAHYEKKTDYILRTLQEHATDEKTLQQQALTIAKIYAGKDSSMGVMYEQKTCIRPCREAKTKRIFIEKHKALKVADQQQVAFAALVSAEPQVKHTKDGKVLVSKTDLENSVKQTAGEIKELQLKQKRAVVAHAVFKKTLEHLQKNKTGHKEKRNTLETLIDQYINGILTATAFTQKLRKQITADASHDPNDMALLGASVKGCLCSASFGNNKTAFFVKQALESSNPLLEKYSAAALAG